MTHIGRIIGALTGLAAAIIACLAAAPAAFANEVPAPGGPAGSPVQVHTIVAGGMPGWQIALIAVGAAVFAAVLAVTADRAFAAHRHAAAPGT